QWPVLLLARRRKFAWALSSLRPPPSSRSGSTGDALLPHPSLLRPVRSIAGVAETGHDECALVEGFVDCSRPDRYVGMGSTHPLDALKGADQANKPYLLSPSFFQPVHRRDRSIRSSKDRNDHNYEPLAEIGWRFKEILDRNESLRLAIKANMRHSRSWNEIAFLPQMSCQHEGQGQIRASCQRCVEQSYVRAASRSR